MELPLLRKTVCFIWTARWFWYYVDNIWFAIAHIYAVIVVGVASKVNTLIDKQPLIAKKFFRKSDPIMFAAGVSIEDYVI